MTRYEKMSTLFDKDFRVIESFPRRVQKEKDSFYEEVFRYYDQDKHRKIFTEKAIALILKVLCYVTCEIYVQDYSPFHKKREGWLQDRRCPTIARLVRKILMKRKGQIDFVLLDEKAIISVSGDTGGVAVYHESRYLKGLLDDLVPAEGLYIWDFHI